MVGIVELVGDQTIDAAGWISLITEHPSLASIPSREGVNPFTGEETVFHPPPTSAQILEKGQRIGTFEWVEGDGNPGLLVSNDSGELTAKLMEIVNDVAKRIGGTFKTTEELDSES